MGNGSKMTGHSEVFNKPGIQYMYVSMSTDRRVVHQV